MSHRYLRLLAIVPVVALTPALTGLHAGTTARAQSAVSVSMINNVYAPPTITITAGTTVTWVNNEDPNGTDVTHDVIDGDGTSWSSDYIDPGQSFSHEYDTPGTYPYFCDLHQNMSGTVVVQ
jgi:plastocyanin